MFDLFTLMDLIVFCLGFIFIWYGWLGFMDRFVGLCYFTFVYIYSCGWFDLLRCLFYFRVLFVIFDFGDFARWFTFALICCFTWLSFLCLYLFDLLVCSYLVFRLFCCLVKFYGLLLVYFVLTRSYLNSIVSYTFSWLFLLLAFALHLMIIWFDLLCFWFAFCLLAVLNYLLMCFCCR